MLNSNYQLTQPQEKTQNILNRAEYRNACMVDYLHYIVTVFFYLTRENKSIDFVDRDSRSKFRKEANLTALIEKVCTMTFTEQYQAADTLKQTLKAKFYIYVNSTTQRCPNKIIKIFLL